MKDKDRAFFENVVAVCIITLFLTVTYLYLTK
jgi:hypothetical protein